MSNDYKISSRDYMARAREQLDRGENYALFYAALEIRSGVEARMHEYLEVQKDISNKKKYGWQINKLSKDIEYMFRLGDKKAVITVNDQNSDKEIAKFEYTPVRSELKKGAEKLGDILHRAKKYHPADDQYWVKLRSQLEDLYKELEFSNSGQLLGPPLMHPKKNLFDMKLELLSNDEAEKTIEKLQLGAYHLVKVHYI